jgi:hypothetical protein
MALRFQALRNIEQFHQYALIAGVDVLDPVEGYSASSRGDLHEDLQTSNLPAEAPTRKAGRPALSSSQAKAIANLSVKEAMTDENRAS